MTAEKRGRLCGLLGLYFATIETKIDDESRGVALVEAWVQSFGIEVEVGVLVNSAQRSVMSVKPLTNGLIILHARLDFAGGEVGELQIESQMVEMRPKVWFRSELLEWVADEIREVIAMVKPEHIVLANSQAVGRSNLQTAWRIAQVYGAVVAAIQLAGVSMNTVPVKNKYSPKCLNDWEVVRGTIRCDNLRGNRQWMEQLDENLEYLARAFDGRGQ